MTELVFIVLTPARPDFEPIAEAWVCETVLQRIRAWREPYQLFSGFSVPQHESDTLQRPTEDFPGGSGQCLSSSLHNRFITF